MHALATDALGRQRAFPSAADVSRTTAFASSGGPGKPTGVSAYIPIVTPRGTTVAMQQLQFAPEFIAALEERGLEALESPLMSGQPVVVPAGGIAHGGATAGEEWGEALGKWSGVPALHKHWSTLGILELIRLLLGAASAPLPPSYLNINVL